MLRWFERRLDPYPTAEPTQPPASMLAFLLHYLKGSKRWLALMAVLTAGIAVSEVLLFGFIGNVVDWLSRADRTTFLATEWPRLAAMAAFILVLLPAIGALQSLTVNQGLMGNI